MPITYTPSAGDSRFGSFAGQSFDDPANYDAANNKRIDAKFFLKPIQDELLNLIRIAMAGGAALPVRNTTGSPLPAGPVRISGYDAANACFRVAPADVSGAQPAEFLLTAALANNSNGLAYMGGEWLSTVDMSGAAVGDRVYLAAGGGVTLSVPSGADSVKQTVGRVKTNANPGTVQGLIEAPIGIGTAWLQDQAVTAAKIANGTITDSQVASANKDGSAGTASLRTLGTGSQQAAAGNHTHAAGDIVSGTLGVSRGGTGAGSLTSNAFLLGNGTGAVQAVGPGSAGQVPVSDGSAPVMKTIGGDATLASDGTLTIANGAVSTAKIADGAATLAKLAQNARVCGNLLINGGFDIFQRQAPATATARSDDAYGPDRWYVLTQSASVNVERGSGDTNSANACKTTQPNAGAQRIGIAQIVESRDARLMRGRTVRFQCRVKVSASQAVRVAIVEHTGTADAVVSDIVNNWTSSDYSDGASKFFVDTDLLPVANSAVTPSAATWTAISVTGSISSNCNNLIVFVWTEGTTNQNDTLELTEAGLYDGADARDWLPRSYTEELLLCQRYCVARESTSGSALNAIAHGHGISSSQAVVGFDLPVRMFAAPTLTATATQLKLRDEVNAAVTVDTSIATHTTHSDFRAVFIATASGGITQYRPYNLAFDGSAVRRVILSAEL